MALGNKDVDDFGETTTEVQTASIAGGSWSFDLQAVLQTMHWARQQASHV